MSNPFAISAVTAAFSQLLLGVREEPTLVGTTVTVGPPDRARSASATGQQLNLFLYEMVSNSGWQNMDLPHRTAEGQLSTRPVLALNLRYLLTGYGQGDDDTDAQHVLGHAMSIVHDQGMLTREQIRAAVQAAPPVSQSDLADQIELVKLCPQGNSIGDIARVWSLYQTTNYRLSTGYEASVVLIERPHPVRAARPPVRSVGLYAVPLRRPVIEVVSPQIAAPAGQLRVRGHNLSGERVSARCGDLAVAVDQLTDAELTLTLPAELPAGVTTVQVMHDIPLEQLGETRRGPTSNVAAFVLAPQILSPQAGSVARGGELTVEFAPAIHPSQRVALLLGDSELTLPARDPGSAPIHSLSVTVPATTTPGTILIRLLVDGAQSPLTVDADPASPTVGQYISPAVTVTG